MTVRILLGDVRSRLQQLPSDSVHCVVTSPPYWGLRDYGVPGQIGLEPTPQAHVAAMVDVFREVRRVLRPDGVCWVNYGDSYATAVNGRSAADTKAAGNDDRTFRDKPFSTVAGGLKPKDLCMIPSRFAIGMQDDGWWLRSMLPWVKRNSMPESIADRPATATEYVFLFSKSERYWYDAEAVRRQAAPSSLQRWDQNIEGQTGSARANGGRKTNGNMKAVGGPRADKQRGHGRRHQGFNERWDAMERDEQIAAGRNFRNTDLFFESLKEPHGLITDSEGRPLALDVPPQPFRDAHFATFPPALIEPMIKAGCPIGGTVLDPFGGAGTTGLVADRNKRNAILIELNPEYAAIARRRIEGDGGLFAAVQIEAAA
ncbi:MAG: site-specific DNA-methyltransferase [Azospirillum sp.]|nr:site-specific DNA-methyltransferase [Azospirillum sp.]